MATMSVPAACICEHGTVFVRVDLDRNDPPELSERCDVCGSALWTTDIADLEELAALVTSGEG